MQSDGDLWQCIELLKVTPEEVDLKHLETTRRDGVSRLKGCIA